MRKKGSAIIVAMMLIAGIGAVAFGIGRIIFMETATATLYENGIVAYYAAESGLEEGFLRYRFNTNASVPGPNASNTNLHNSNYVFRETLSDMTVGGTHANTVNTGGASMMGITPDPPGATLQSDQLDDQLYHLRMAYLGSNGNPLKTDGKPWYGHDVANTSGALTPDGQLTKHDLRKFSSTTVSDYASGDYANLRISRDNAAKIDLTNIDIDDGNIRPVLMLSFDSIGLAPTFPALEDTALGRCRAMAELKLSIVESGVFKEYKELTSLDPGGCSPVINISSSKLIDNLGSAEFTAADANRPATLFYEVDLTNILRNAGVTIVNGVPVTLTIHPLNYNVSVGLYARSCNTAAGVNACTSTADIMPGPFTSIVSRGYYGGVTRTLVANIDRQSGTLYDLFDYVIFKEN